MIHRKTKFDGSPMNKKGSLIETMNKSLLSKSVISIPHVKNVKEFLLNNIVTNKAKINNKVDHVFQLHFLKASFLLNCCFIPHNKACLCFFTPLVEF